jgi:hypothetical protein
LETAFLRHSLSFAPRRRLFPREVVSSRGSGRLPAYLGAEAVFLPAAGFPAFRPDAAIGDLRALRGKRTLVGYLYGGIRAFPPEFPYHDEAPLYRSGNVPTRASDLILAVYVTEGARELQRMAPASVE